MPHWVILPKKKGEFTFITYVLVAFPKKRQLMATALKPAAPFSQPLSRNPLGLLLGPSLQLRRRAGCRPWRIGGSGG